MDSPINLLNLNQIFLLLMPKGYTHLFLAVHICISILWLTLTHSIRHLCILLIFISVGQLPLIIFSLMQFHWFKLIQSFYRVSTSRWSISKIVRPYEQYFLFALYIYIILMNEYFYGTIRINNQITKLTLVKSIIDRATVIYLW